MMKKICLVVAALALLAVGIGIQTGCKPKSDPANPTFNNFWETALPEGYTPCYNETTGATCTPTVTFTATLTWTPTVTPTATPTACVPSTQFGYTGSLTNADATTGVIRAGLYNLSVPGVVASMQVSIGASPEADDQIMVGIYADASGAPGTLIVGSARQPAMAGWNVFDVADTALAAGDYWLAYATDNAATGLGVDVPYESNSGAVYYGRVLSPFTTMPDPFGTTTLGPMTYDVGIIAEYCP